MAVLETTSGEINARAVVRKDRLDRLRDYIAIVVLVDALAAMAAAFVTYGWRVHGLAFAQGQSVLRDVATVAMPLVWVVVLALHRAYDRPSAGRVATGTRQIIQAAIAMAAVVSTVCLALRYPNLIDYVLVGIPVAAVLTILMRHVTTAWLRARHRGLALRRGLVVGHAVAVAEFVSSLARDQSAGIQIVGTCLADDATARHAATLAVPVYGDLTDVPGVATGVGCELVIVLPSPRLDARRLRELSWDLHDAGIDLLVAPALSDVARERITVQPAGGLALLHVRAPVLSGPQRVLKGFLDRVVAGALLLIAAPLLVAVALLVRLTSSGPALFRQRRVGLRGKEFTCLKFRTMTTDAEARRDEIAHLNERQDGLLFKIRRDPRVTRIGAFLRRYSVDELPQLINVLAGDMSLVGPRPPLPREVAAYDAALHRRLLVKPGMTGLWQVSGRAELSWAESVRLDLSYVDNWSPALDARILLRTVSAVVRGTGAY